MAPVIETIELTKRYRGTTALDSLNLELAEGDVLGFLGPNGAGLTQSGIGRRRRSRIPGTERRRQIHNGGIAFGTAPPNIRSSQDLWLGLSS